MRQASGTLKSFLDNWTSATPVSVADLYIFTLVTGEVFYYSGFQTPLAAITPGGSGELVTNGATPTGTNTLYFPGPLPAWLQRGMIAQDVTNSGVLPGNSIVLDYGVDNGHVAISQNSLAPGVSSGDSIQFFYNFVLGPRFARTKTKIEVGPQVDELNIDIYAGQNDLLGMNSGGTITWQDALFLGLFDGAYCELLRGFLTGTPYPQVVGTITWFYGRIGDVDVGRTKTSVRVKSLLDLLTVQMPRRLFQSACTFVFGEPGTGMCGYDRINGLNAAGASTGIGAQTITCQAGSSQNVIFTTFVPGVETSYDNGSIVGLTGLNAGFQRTIGKLNSSTSPSTINFLKPFIFPVVAGTDTFQLLPGCDHTLDTCTNTFNNRARYGGFPFIPPPETAV